ncbi:MAG: hypothetical protein M1823_006166, partial [Watsoniomyces obsoletus]
MMTTGLPTPAPTPPEPIDSSTSPSSSNPNILIIGAGIVGLTLAQALRKKYPWIQCTIYERDADPQTRGPGWGLTIHWALSTFQDLLPDGIVERLEETFVDPVASREGDGKFLFLDLRTAEQRWRVPPNRRIRVRRERLRRLLMEGVDIKWSKSVTSISNTPDNQSVTATFSDGSSATGSLLIGCDGTRSRVRQIICPDHHRNTILPVRLLGVSVPYTGTQAGPIRALDPFFLQGGDPETDAFFWFSFLDTPSSRKDGKDEYTCQILTSWPYRAGFLGEKDPIEIPATNIERIQFMKRLAKGWAEPFRSVVLDIPEDADAKVISLEDWPPPKVSNGDGKKAVKKGWDHFQGKVTLAGDAGHAMVM